MAAEIQPQDSETGVATLVAGIVHDARELILEQMKLFQIEIKNDIKRTAFGIMPIMSGMLVVFVGVLLLGIGAANLLAWLVPDMPLWLGYVCVGGATFIAGAFLVFVGKSILETVHPTDTALKGLKENLQWKTKK
jgi:hypothetical protein